MVGAGAAVGATGLAAQVASAGSKIAAGTSWLSVLKWTAVIAIGLPATGVAVRWAEHREARSVAGVTLAAVPQPPQALTAGSIPLELASPSDSTQASTPAPVVVPDARKHSALMQRGHGASGVEPSSQEASSALRRESLALEAAREKFAAGDLRGALDGVARVGVDFPHGRLTQEREVLAMDCLAALGDGEGARTRALAFLGRFPASPYIAHVRPLAQP